MRCLLPLYEILLPEAIMSVARSRLIQRFGRDWMIYALFHCGVEYLISIGIYPKLQSSAVPPFSCTARKMKLSAFGTARCSMIELSTRSDFSGWKAQGTTTCRNMPETYTGMRWMISPVPSPNNAKDRRERRSPHPVCRHRARIGLARFRPRFRDRRHRLED